MSFFVTIEKSVRGLVQTVCSQIVTPSRQILKPQDPKTWELGQFIFHEIGKLRHPQPPLSEGDASVLLAFMQTRAYKKLSFQTKDDHQASFEISFEGTRPILDIYTTSSKTTSQAIKFIVQESKECRSVGEIYKRPRAEQSPLVHALFGADRIQTIQVTNAKTNTISVFSRNLRPTRFGPNAL